MTKRSAWVAFEGPDGAGKSTLAQALVSIMDDAVLFPSPSEHEVGRLARSTLQVPGIALEARQLMFLSDTIDSYFRDIVPALLEGKTVISDRWVMSTLVYHEALLTLVGAQEEGVDSAEALFDVYAGLTAGQGPDITFFVDTPGPVRSERIDSREDEEMNDAERSFQALVSRIYDRRRREESIYDHGSCINFVVSGLESVDLAAQWCKREIERRPPPELVVYQGLFNRLRAMEGSQ